MNAEELAEKAQQQIILHEKEKERQQMKLQATKHRQTEVIQERLNARLKAREENKGKGKKVVEKVQVKHPTGDITFALVTIKEAVTILEIANEEIALKTLEDIHDVLTKDLVAHNVYKARDEIGKMLLATQNVEDMINLSIKIQEKFNCNKWDTAIMKIPAFKKLFRPEDASKENATPLFNGPRLTFSIHSGEASVKVDGDGNATYSGLNVMKTETIANFAQGGQTILSASTWDKVDQSKLMPHHVTHLGIYKLEGFSAGCKLLEVLPQTLKDRSKFFGSVCAHCSEVIQPKEKFFRALDCIWHMNHFRCFQCNVDLSGSYLEYEGSPFCKTCYLTKTAPKCKNCSNPVTAGYINALNAYWHVDCFSCKRCLKKPSAEISIYEFDGYPYCGDCYKQVGGD